MTSLKRKKHSEPGDPARTQRSLPIRRSGNNVVPINLAARLHSEPECRKRCAYNLTRGIYLSAEVEEKSSFVDIIVERLKTVPMESDAAFWFSSFHHFPWDRVQTPSDLIFVDSKGIVLDLVNFLPGGRIQKPDDRTTGVLVVPANTIARTRTHRGDKIMFAPLGERELTGTESSGLNENDQTGIGSQSAPNTYHADRRLPKIETASTSERLGHVRRIAKSAQVWWQHWWYVDPRRAEREVAPRIVARFFTGGEPISFAVRDISSQGIYVLTDERWYRGTVIRMTLTDQDEQSTERSITVSAMVVRSGSDGVGFRFVYPEKKRQVREVSSYSGDFSPEVNPEKLAKFLERVRRA